MTPRHITNNLMDGPRAVAAVTRIGMIAYLVFTTIMWAINSWGKMELNFAFVFISFFGVLCAVVSPTVTVPWLGLYVVSPAAAKEVKQVLLKLLFSFMLTATFLATWSFGASPWSFWALFALLLGLLTWQLVHKDEFGNITKKIQLGYLLVFIALILLKTMGVDLGSKVSASAVESKTSSLSLPSVSWGGSSSTTEECPEEVLSVVYGTRLTIPMGCKVNVDTTLVRDGKYEYEFADEKLPIVDGKRLLNGKPIEAYITHSFFYPGRDRWGMRFTTTNKSAFQEAGKTYVEIIIKRPGQTAVEGIDLTPE